MKSLKIFGSPFTIFYVVFAYTMAFSIWWAYLLFAKNEAAFREKIELDKIHFQERYGNNLVYEQTKAYLLQHQKYERQKVMIITEGSVFVILLLLGLLQVRKVFSKEIDLAAQQRNFLLSITHELKSPLAAIKLSLQTMSKRSLEPERSEKLIHNSLSDIDRLESLVENILLAAKIEREEHGLSKTEVNISSLVEDIAKRYTSNKKNVQVTFQIKPNILLETDMLGFTSVVINLIENAIKYSDPGKTVLITLDEDEAYVTLNVIDEGVGIPAEEREKVFQKFYRIGNEETRKTKGTGLGLYIVKRFIEIYDGTIAIASNQPQGTIFKLSLPR